MGDQHPIAEVTVEDVIRALMRLRDETFAAAEQEEEGGTRWVLKKGKVAGVDAAIGAIADLEIAAVRAAYPFVFGSESE